MFNSTVPSSSNPPAVLVKANMFFLSREATEKDRSLKIKMLVTFDMTDKEKIGEVIWPEMEYFSDQRANFNMSKKNFPEVTLVYLKNGTVSTIKNELAIYVNCFIFVEIIPALNSPTWNLISVNQTRSKWYSHCITYLMVNFCVSKKDWAMLFSEVMQKRFFSYMVLITKPRNCCFRHQRKEFQTPLLLQLFASTTKKLWKSITLKRSRTYSSFCLVSKTGRDL